MLIYKFVRPGVTQSAGDIEAGYWTETQEGLHLLDIPADETVYGETHAEIRQKLQERYPPGGDEPGLTRVIPPEGYHLRGHTVDFMISDVDIAVLSTQEDLERFVAYVLQTNKSLHYLADSTGHLDWAKCPCRQDTRQDIWLGHSKINRLLAVRMKSRKPPEQRKKPIPGRHTKIPSSIVKDVIYELKHTLEHFNIALKCYQGYDVGNALGHMVDLVAVYNLYFGPHAHRKTWAFQELCRRWVQQRPGTAKWLKTECSWAGADKIAKWLDREAKAKMPKVRKERPKTCVCDVLLRYDSAPGLLKVSRRT